MALLTPRRYKNATANFIAQFAVATVGFLLLYSRSPASTQGRGTAQSPTVAGTNVRVERLEGGTVRITYDLNPPAGAATTYAVNVEVSEDGGQTFGIKTRSVSGDAGASVRAGRGK